MQRRMVLMGLALSLAGCASAPAPAPAPSRPEQQVAMLKSLGFESNDDGWTLNLSMRPILFPTDVDVMVAEDQMALRRIATDLLKVGIDRVRIEGHTDNIGSHEYNQGLSQRRAEAAARAFIEAGIADDHIVRVGYAFDKPIASNATPEGRAKNRRVVIIVQP